MSDAIGFDPHDHSACKATAMARAEQISADRGLRFTPVRRRVLEILLETHSAMGAYDILERLAQEGLGSQPPVAYRALSFLIDLGVVHKVERLNAYVACAHPGQLHQPAFMICRSCGKVAEGRDDGTLAGAANDLGFVMEHTVIEAEGLCTPCGSDAD